MLAGAEEDADTPKGVYEFNCSTLSHEEMRFKAPWVSDQQVREMSLCVSDRRRTNVLTGNADYNRKLFIRQKCAFIAADPEPVQAQIDYARRYCR